MNIGDRIEVTINKGDGRSISGGYRGFFLGFGIKSGNTAIIIETEEAYKLEVEQGEYSDGRKWYADRWKMESHKEVKIVELDDSTDVRPTAANANRLAPTSPTASES